uniref:Uncharacterized protein n=1 Tax=Auxenochlorella protothecoides TaxID=3075 RepID=A0A1D1ZWZ4_AUXPR
MTGAAWALACVALLGVASAAVTQDRILNCVPPTQPHPGTGKTCRSMALIQQGDAHRYTYHAESPGSQDILITVASPKADITVLSALGIPLVASGVLGDNQFMLSRAAQESDPGPYELIVRGVVPETQYTVSTTVHERRRCLAGRDRSALQSVLEGPGCCSAPGSCARLRAALSADPAQDMCDQPGSLCDDAGQLVKLDLSDQGLECPVPPGLAILSALQHLDLSGNNLSGSLEGALPSLGALPRLRHLRLAHNRLTGSLPCDLLREGLVSLDLAGNALTGAVPACYLASPSLRELSLRHNLLQGDLPAPGSQAALESLQATHMGLTGSVPSFQAASRLTHLDLQHNRLEGPLPALPPSLLSLSLQGNMLSGSIGEGWVAGLPALQSLDLGANSLTGGLPEGLAAAPHLRKLRLARNVLSGPLPGAWRAWRLAALDVSGNRLAGELPTGLARLPALRSLALASNRGLCGDVARFLAAALAARSPLRALDASWTGVGCGEEGLPPSLAALAMFRGGEAAQGLAVVGGDPADVFDATDAEAPASPRGRLSLRGTRVRGPFPVWVLSALARAEEGQGVQIDLAATSLTCPGGEDVANAARALPASALARLHCTDAAALPSTLARQATALRADAALDLALRGAAARAAAAWDRAGGALGPAAERDASRRPAAAAAGAALATAALALAALLGTLGYNAARTLREERAGRRAAGAGPAAGGVLPVGGALADGRLAAAGESSLEGCHLASETPRGTDPLAAAPPSPPALLSPAAASPGGVLRRISTSLPRKPSAEGGEAAASGAVARKPSVKDDECGGMRGHEHPADDGDTPRIRAWVSAAPQGAAKPAGAKKDD